MNWRCNFNKDAEIVLVTSSKKSVPNANVVISLGLIDDKLLIANCQMDTTFKNLQDNSQVCVIGGYFRIKGQAKIFSTGKYYDKCIRENKDYLVKNAILITIKEVFDLDKVKIVK